jgi:predicted PhzF superfamily epimerase YddE/YHI9
MGGVMGSVRVVRVFANSEGKYGNPLGVIEDGPSVPEPERRQVIASGLGFSESVFIDNPDTASIRIYSGKREVPFAGHAAVGAAWLLGRITGSVPAKLRTAAGDAETWEKDGATWVRSTLGTTPAWWHERLRSPEEVEALTGPLDPSQDMTQLWAWQDEAAGIMRVRTFAARAGIPEDEACGSGAMRMVAAFGRPLKLYHGQGSVIFTSPGPPGYADIGGFVAEDSNSRANF